MGVLGSGWPALGKGAKKKSRLVMVFFRKGSDPPPLIFGSYGTREAHFNFGHKNGEKQNFPKTPKMAIFNINFLGKVP